MVVQIGVERSIRNNIIFAGVKKVTPLWGSQYCADIIVPECEFL